MATDNATSWDPLPRDARHQVGYYKALPLRALLREAQLKEQLAQHQLALTGRQQRREAELLQRIADLEAEGRLLKQRLYGRRCEAHHTPNTLAHDPATSGDVTAAPAPPRRRRGQQRGRPGHGRRPYDHLPVTHETADLPPDQRHCTRCGRPFAPCGRAGEPCRSCGGGCAHREDRLFTCAPSRGPATLPRSARHVRFGHLP